MKESFPAVAVVSPAGEGADALEGGVAHGGLEDGVVGELLHAGGEGGDVADGDDEAFDAVGEEVFAAGVGGAEDGQPQARA